MRSEALLEPRVHSELSVSQEKPRNTTLVTLPELFNGQVRLGMHTDTTLNLFRIFDELEDTVKESLKIQGRVLTPDQRHTLEAHPMYGFFMQSRFARFQGASQYQGLRFIMPSDIDLSEEQIQAVIGQSFSPSTLSDALGYGVGYYSVAEILEQRGQGSPTTYQALFGGCNEFTIGSETLSIAELERVASQIRRRLAEMDTGVPVLPKSALNITQNFKVYEIKKTLDYPSSLKFEKNEIFENIITKNIINTPSSAPTSKYSDVLSGLIPDQGSRPHTKPFALEEATHTNRALGNSRSLLERYFDDQERLTFPKKTKSRLLDELLGTKRIQPIKDFVPKKF